MTWTASDKDEVTAYKIFYGPSKDKLVWNTMVKGLTVDLGNLPKDLTPAVQVYGTDDCVLGPASTVVIPSAPPATGMGGR